MKKYFYLLAFITSQLSAQNISLSLDTTTIHHPTFYHKVYQLQHTEQRGGEGWKLEKASKLKHAFYEVFHGNPFHHAGSWIMRNDSIIFFIKSKKLKTKYGYRNQQAFKPFLISWELRTDWKNQDDESKQLVFKNKLIILNNGGNPTRLINELQMKLEKLKTDTDPVHVNEAIINECKNALFEKKIFVAVETLRESY